MKPLRQSSESFRNNKTECGFCKWIGKNRNKLKTLLKIVSFTTRSILGFDGSNIKIEPTLFLQHAKKKSKRNNNNNCKKITLEQNILIISPKIYDTINNLLRSI